MTINAGVWIDHHKAVVVLITDDGEDIRHILSDVKKTAHSTSGVRVKNSYTRNDFVAEDKLERKVENHLKEYYDKVISHLSDADSILFSVRAKPRASLKSAFRGRGSEDRLLRWKRLRR